MGNLLAILASCLYLSAVIGNAPLPEHAKPKLIGRSYDLRAILGERSATRKLPDADAVVQLLLENIGIGSLKPESSGPQIVIRDNTNLEILATVETHKEIKEFLEALERLADLAIDIESSVIELDPANFERMIKALPKPEKGKPKTPIILGDTDGNEVDASDTVKTFEAAIKWLKSGRLIQNSKARFVNGIEKTLASRQAVWTYHPNQDEAKKPSGPLLHVKDGFVLRAFPLVTPDRRFVRFKLMEQSTIVHGMKVREIRGLGNAFMGGRVTPDIRDLGTIGSALVPDGGALIFRLEYAPKDKVWVVVVKPTIFIQAEEDALKEEASKKEGKK